MTSTPALQPYALAVVACRSTLAIKAVSEHAERICGIPADKLIGSALTSLLPARCLEDLPKEDTGNTPAVVSLEDSQMWSDQPYQALIYSTAEEWVVEIEPRCHWPQRQDYAQRLSNFLTSLTKASSLKELLQALCDGVAHHLGFDRSIILRFDQHFEAVVAYECKADTLSSFLGIHFTSQDIPKSSRDNLLINAVEIYSLDGTGNQALRGTVSKESDYILRHYLGSREPNVNTDQFLIDNQLRTNGVLALAQSGSLWGALYLHGIAPVRLDYQMRTFLRLAGQTVEHRLSYFIGLHGQGPGQPENIYQKELYHNIVRSESLVDGLIGQSVSLLDLIPETQGAAICTGGSMSLYKQTPDEETINAIVKWIKKEQNANSIWTTDQLTSYLPREIPSSSLPAGVLFLPLDTPADHWIIWFRSEAVRSVVYGSSQQTDETRGRRFKQEQSLRRKYSRRWSEQDIGMAKQLQSFIRDAVMKRYDRARQQNALLQEAYNDLEIFSYAIGHDLGVPLRGITSYAEILQEDFSELLGKKGAEHLRVIRDNAQRIKVFIRELLALSRIERTKILVNRLSVATLVKRAIAGISDDGEEELHCTVQEDIPDIFGDRSYLLLVFTNLLSNAFKYSAGEPQPRVSVGCIGEYRRGNPIFYVKDNGIGIPADQQTRMFELFTRSTNVDEIEGTGIGLALVRRIIRFHEGEVWLESELGKGTKVYFYTGVEL